ncbi:MAG TPA: hypothetical protein VJZ27_03670, partial [Aggregatilineales bacterium]|nr:hypothetical protein [Aggregatilineales bacterium]
DTAPAATEEVADVAAPANNNLETFTLSGSVVNGTEGGSVPDDLLISLRIAGLDASGAPQELYFREIPLADDSSFTFPDVPRDPRSIGILQTEYAGIHQLAPEIFPGDTTGDTVEVNLPIYETTDTLPEISVQYVENRIDAVTAEEASQTFQVFIFQNDSDRIYTGDEDGHTLTIPLPHGALNPQVDAFGDSGTRFQLIQEGDQVIYYDTQPVYPGRSDQINTSFNFRYPGSMQLEVEYPYPVQEVGVFISEPRGLELESDQFSPIQSADLNGITYRGFELQPESLAAGETISFRIFDGENATSAAAPENPASSVESSNGFLEDNTTLILGIGVLLLLAGGMFLFYDLQKARIQAQAARPEGLSRIPDNQDDIVAAIAALDTAYEAGELDDDRYEAQREALKAALRHYLKK